MSGLGLRLAFPTRSSLRLTRFKSRWGSRDLHKAAPLPYSVEEGLGEFLPPAALKTVAEEYQNGLLERLNEQIRGTEHENANLVDTIINTSDDESAALAFNYASLALNNGYFLDMLKPNSPTKPHHQNEITTNLGATIREQHGTLAQLKSAVSAAAMGMFTNGNIWFVTDAAGNTGVLPTFGPGTLLIRSRSYIGHASWYDTLEQAIFTTPGEAHFDPSLAVDPLDPNPKPTSTPPGASPQSPTSGVRGTLDGELPKGLRGLRFMHTSAVRRQQKFNNEVEEVEDIIGEEGRAYIDEDLSHQEAVADAVGELEQEPMEPMSKGQAINSGDVIYPLFCLPVYEHAWMAAGYGVWGKEEWLKKFWTVLDWQKISARYEAIKSDPYKITY